MRIISKTHDYYDSAMAQGADQSLVYLRKSEKTPGARDDIGIPLDALPRLEREEGTDTYATHVLLFCGQYLPFVERRLHTWSPRYEEIVTRFWDLASLDAAIAEASPEVRKAYARRHNRGLKFLCREGVAQVFAHRTDPAKLAEIHTAHESPVILYRTGYQNIHCPDVETEINPSLKDLGFQTQRDPFTAFQEIAMYLGGVMRTPERSTASISDNVRIAKHGFDEWSFRKKVR